tara:strand:+ start:844 stop:957 length:114 start_codon:yes stop_codon:yes gene_type:complete
MPIARDKALSKIDAARKLIDATKGGFTVRFFLSVQAQ